MSTLPRLSWIAVALVAVSAAPASAQEPAPVLEQSVVVAPVSGQIQVKEPGATRAVLLERSRAIPTGSLVDATRGTVQLVTAGAAAGTTQSGRFDGGAFVVRQARSALTDLVLADTAGEFGVCGSAARASRRKALPPRVIRRLHGQAHGNFRTVGRYAAASVRGTEWSTVDRCDGTLTSTKKGVVETSIGTQTFGVSAGMSLVAYCYPPGSAFNGPQYCTAILLEPDAGIFGWAIATRLHPDAPSYDLCLTDPRARVACMTLPLGPPNETGVRIGELVCQQGRIGGPGVYRARWLIGGRQVGVPLSFTLTRPKPDQQGLPCLQKP